MADREMPQAVKIVFDTLSDDVARLFHRYKIFKQVYGTHEAVDLLNESAPDFFGEIREIFLENIMMIISQLTDVPRTGKKENTTIQRLVDAIETHEPGLPRRIGLTDVTVGLEGHTKAIREVRNRTLAHNDWGRRDEPLPPVMKEEIDRSLAAFERALQVTSLHFRAVDLRCEPFMIADGDHLIAVLGEWRECSKRHENWRRANEG